MEVVEVVGAALATGRKMSLPTSKVLLLVQYVSRGPSFNQ
jgi:microcompartment protein CcmK/EutM